MKIALYIEDGLEQIVLTPEGETETAILGKLSDGSRDLSIVRGSFYECRGGWVRHKRTWTDSVYGGSGEDSSTMIVLRPKPPKQSAPAPCPACLGEAEGCGVCNERGTAE